MQEIHQSVEKLPKEEQKLEEYSESLDKLNRELAENILKRQ